MVITESEALKTIQADLPSLEATQIRRDGFGLNNVTFLVDNRYYFRFPRGNLLANKMKGELKCLQLLRDKFHIRNIPDFEYTVLDSKNYDFLYTGCRKFPGRILHYRLYESLDEKTKENVLRSIADFLIRLHSLKPEDFNGDCRMRFNGQYYTQMFYYDVCKAELSRYFKGEQLRYFMYFVDRFYSNVDEYNKTIVFNHSDLSGYHLIYDEKQKNISGYLDFGGCGLGDSTYDLLKFTGHYGIDVLDALLKYYPVSNYAETIDKIKAYIIMNLVKYLNTYGEYDSPYNDRLFQLAMEGFQNALDGSFRFETKKAIFHTFHEIDDLCDTVAKLELVSTI